MGDGTRSEGERCHANNSLTRSVEPTYLQVRHGQREASQRSHPCVCGLIPKRNSIPMRRSCAESCSAQDVPARSKLGIRLGHHAAWLLAVTVSMISEADVGHANNPIQSQHEIGSWRLIP